MKNGETHIVCNKRLKEQGGKSKCCDCFPHEDCDFVEPKERKCERCKNTNLDPEMKFCRHFLDCGFDECTEGEPKETLEYEEWEKDFMVLFGKQKVIIDFIHSILAQQKSTIKKELVDFIHSRTSNGGHSEDYYNFAEALKSKIENL